MTWTNKFLNIWVIDDKIPISDLDPLGTEILSEMLPIRSDVLYTLLSTHSGAWEDLTVKNLISALLLQKKVTTTAFFHPTHAIESLKQGIVAPDLIIFDWEYTSGTDSELHAWLTDLLCRSFTFVKIYSHRPLSDIETVISGLDQSVQRQLLGITKKHDRADELIAEINTLVQGTFAGDMAVSLRMVSETAIGTTLRYYMQLPRELLLSQSAEEVQDLIANLVDRDIQAVGLEVGQEQVERISVDIARRTSEDVRVSDDLNGALQASKLLATASAGQAVIPEAAKRQFQAQQVYVKHSTDRVLTGDIAILDERTTMLVMTPSCNLNRFSTKTRNTLTYLKVFNWDQNGWNVLASGQAAELKYSRSNTKVSTSLTASSKVGTEGIFMLASVPFGKNGINFLDMFVLPDRIEFKNVDQVKCEYNFGVPLKYSDLKKEFPHAERLARLSEPYMNSLFWAVAQYLFSPGTREYLGSEVTRITQFASDNFS